VTKRRKEGRARKKSTSEDYGNDIHFFSLSASCFSRALRTFFLSSPPSPCFSCDSPTILRPLPTRSCENVGIYKVEHSRSRPKTLSAWLNVMGRHQTRHRNHYARFARDLYAGNITFVKSLPSR